MSTSKPDNIKHINRAQSRGSQGDASGSASICASVRAANINMSVRITMRIPKGSLLGPHRESEKKRETGDMRSRVCTGYLCCLDP